MDRRKPSVLLISEVAGGSLQALLEQQAIDLVLVPGAEEAAARLEMSLFDAVILADSGEASAGTLASLAERWPDTALVLCGPPGAELARRALAAGAADYLSEPVSPAALTHALDAAQARAGAAPPTSLATGLDFGLLGSSAQMLVVKETVARVASSQTTVLVRGETGTGKQLVARAVHAGSARRDAPFVTVHAAALPDALLESELFGYERGAFTGASARKAGRVELAEGGTLFFDEIGELSMSMQVKLLRLLQDREYERLGGTRTLRADLRFVAATHRDIEHMVAAGTFREDLFYRLNVVTIWLPPLRARRADIAVLVQHYLELFRAANGKPTLTLEGAALRLLQAQRWPGNVRQLVNFIERLVVLANGDLIREADVRRDLEEQIAFLTQAASVEELQRAPEQLPLGSSLAQSEPPSPLPVATQPLAAAREPDFSSAVRPLKEDMRRSELRALTKALHSAKGNRALAARLLGVSRRTLYTKLEEHGIL